MNQIPQNKSMLNSVEKELEMLKNKVKIMEKKIKAMVALENNGGVYHEMLETFNRVFHEKD